MSLWKKLIWFAVAALGTWAVAMLALSRGEPISALWIVAAGFCALSISYRFYSKWLATKVLVLNEERATPAVLQNDNKDYVPTNRWMVFGHHFAAIAGPGPLVGPVLAAQFGFLPGHSLDFDRSNAWRWRSRYDCSFCLNPPRRQNAWSNGTRRNRARRRPARSGECPGDHDYFAGGPRASRSASSRRKSLGRFHHRGDDSDRTDHGHWIAHRQSERDGDHDLWPAWSRVWRVGRPISRALSRD